MKILIIGPVGAGKTMLAKQLSKKYNIRHYEIDSIVHEDNEDGRKRSKEEQNRIINQIDAGKDWIIEGTLRLASRINSKEISINNNSKIIGKGTFSRADNIENNNSVGSNS